MSEKKIEIVGAGPSGLTAAIVLRKAGYSVKVFEERKDVGLRFHGDFQGLENWSDEEDVLDQFRRIGITINFRCGPFQGGTLYGPDRERAEIRSDRPLFYLVRRGPVEDSLDQGLKAQALAAGVEIEFGRRVEKVEGTAITGTGPKGADVLAKGVTFETDLADCVLGIFDDRLSPGGYCYLLVHQGQATMATVLFREFRRERECFERMKEVFQELVSFKMENAREFGGIGNFFLRTREGHGSHLYVGECGGFQDILWGFGIRYAVVSGYEAAQSVIQGSSYDVLWRDQLLPGLRASIVNRLLVDRLGHFAYRYMIRRLSRDGDARKVLNRIYRWRPWKGLLLPLATRHYHSRVRDERCLHPETCDCVWCRCQRK